MINVYHITGSETVVGAEAHHTMVELYLREPGAQIVVALPWMTREANVFIDQMRAALDNAESEVLLREQRRPQDEEVVAEIDPSLGAGASVEAYRG